MVEFEQLSFLDDEKPLFKIKNPIMLIELFAGVGSQAMACLLYTSDAAAILRV